MPRPAGMTEAGDRRRIEILQKAEELLVAGTFRDMRMDAIADAIGVAKSTLYHYFPKKDDILFELMRETLLTLLGRDARRDQASMMPSERLRECMNDLMELTSASPGKARALYEQKSSLDAAQVSVIDELERGYLDVIVGIIRGGIAANEFRDIDPVVGAHAVIAMGAHSRHWYSPRGRYRPRDVADFFWSIFMVGASLDPKEVSADSSA